jgi:antitoxin (DNA-binding transcriptional repressor) of toxin-antitoxin stability system
MVTLNTRQLRASLPRIVGQVRRGAHFLVLYRSHPAFRIVPVDSTDAPTGSVAEDSLFHAAPVGRSRDGKSACDHDAVLYGS